MLDFEEFAQLIKGNNDEFTEEEKKSKMMEAFTECISLKEKTALIQEA